MNHPPLSSNGAGNDPGWVSMCSNGTCVEVQLTSRMAYVRDSKAKSLGIQQPIIAVDLAEWDQFKGAVTGSAPVDADARLQFRDSAGGMVEIVDTSTDTILEYNSDEWTAFTTGLRSGRFSTRYIEASMAV